MRYLIVVFLALTGAAAFSGTPIRAADVPQSRQQIQLSFAPLVKQVAPAVVNVFSERVVESRGPHPFMNDPLFRRLFKEFGLQTPMRRRAQRSLGSGVIVDQNGTIVTNAHVVGDAQEITVMLADGREFDAELILSDEPTDLALLKIDAGDAELPVARLRPSEELEVGDLVVAIGNPFGVGQTVTSGIVSATARTARGITDFNFFIQTDAAINPGNSGGPLVALDGRVVGINTAIYSRDGGSLGISFAIPSEMVAAVLGSAESGQVTERGIVRPWLGLQTQDVTSDIAENLGMSRPRGAIITALHPLSPGREAGLRKQDVILALNGNPIRSAAEIRFRFVMTPIGESARITYWRKGETQTLSVKAIAPPEKPPRNATRLQGQHPFQGAVVMNMSPAVAEEMGLEPDINRAEGVVLADVRANSPAARLGLQPGDEILSVNTNRIENVAQLTQTLARAEQNAASAWQLTLRRGGRTQNVIIR